MCAFFVTIAFMALNFVFSILATTFDVAFKNIDDVFANLPPKKCLRSMFDNLFVVFKANVKTSDIVFTKLAVLFTPFDTCFDVIRAKFVEAAFRFSNTCNLRAVGPSTGTLYKSLYFQMRKLYSIEKSMKFICLTHL